jgi:hypothetical protein
LEGCTQYLVVLRVNCAMKSSARTAIICPNKHGRACFVAGAHSMQSLAGHQPACSLGALTAHRETWRDGSSITCNSIHAVNASPVTNGTIRQLAYLIWRSPLLHTSSLAMCATGNSC